MKDTRQEKIHAIVIIWNGKRVRLQAVRRHERTNEQLRNCNYSLKIIKKNVVKFTKKKQIVNARGVNERDQRKFFLQQKSLTGQWNIPLTSFQFPVSNFQSFFPNLSKRNSSIGFHKIIEPNARSWSSLRRRCFGMNQLYLILYVLLWNEKETKERSEIKCSVWKDRWLKEDDFICFMPFNEN